MSNTVVVRFVFDKVDGEEFPSYDLMTEKEKNDPASMCYFLLDWDAYAAGKSLQEDVDNQFIEEYEIIYNGISQYDENECGIKIVDENLSGYPEPIIKFNFSKEVNPTDFLTGVFGSCVNVQSIAQKENEESGVFYEDHNGYCHILEDEDAEDWIEELKEFGVYSGKVIKRENFNEKVCLETIK